MLVSYGLVYFEFENKFLICLQSTVYVLHSTVMENEKHFRCSQTMAIRHD